MEATVCRAGAGADDAGEGLEQRFLKDSRFGVAFVSFVIEAQTDT
jgi:hypothetical protein